MIELLGPTVVGYTGEFATISSHRGKQLTFWQFGEPVWHATGKELDETLAHLLDILGWNWANDVMKAMFEQDVILAGE